MDIKREIEGGRMQCFMKKEDKSLIYIYYVENVETTYFDNCPFFAALAYFLLHFCLIYLSLVLSIAFYATYIFTSLSGVFIVLSCYQKITIIFPLMNIKLIVIYITDLFALLKHLTIVNKLNSIEVIYPKHGKF